MMAVICAPLTSSSSLSSGKDSSSGAGAGAGVSSSSAARSAAVCDPRRWVARKNAPEGARVASAHETRDLGEARGVARAPAAVTAVRETAKDMLRDARSESGDTRGRLPHRRRHRERLFVLSTDRLTTEEFATCAASVLSVFPGRRFRNPRGGRTPSRALRGTHSRARLVVSLGAPSEGSRLPLPLPRLDSRGGPFPSRRRTADTSPRRPLASRATRSPWRTGTTATGTRC